MSTSGEAPPTTGAEAGDHGHGHGGKLGALALAALGVVFGDIGTSPLYALKECVHGEHGVEPNEANVLGVLSLVFYSLVGVVALKYLTFVMRADNQGEGGILALLALVPEKIRSPGGAKIGWVAGLVVFGAALLYGDGIITPAISVLSAIEGLEVATTSLHDIVVPATCVVLLGLFAIQHKGTAGVGKVFGPVMVVWFVTIGGLGAFHAAKNLAVFGALDPRHGVRFFLAHGFHGFAVLGSVVLAITGGEALYADMGHFGARPIRVAWYGLVMPALLLNYLGQGALILADPKAAENPFYALVPAGPATYVLVALAAAATVIASQALISGAFSLSHQAVQLGFLPRVTVEHTSQETEGQIYVPEVNWALAVACLALVVMFKESSRLAAAYGIAVTGTMGITSIVYFVVVRKTWGWSLAKAAPIVAVFLAMDLAFFGANLLKFLDGGYVPVLVAILVFVVMVTWKSGRAILAETLAAASPPLDAFLATLGERCRARVPGTAVFLTSGAQGTPPVLVHHVRHSKVLHETVVLLTVVNDHVPRVDVAETTTVDDLGQGFHRVVTHAGFTQMPDVPEVLAIVRERGVPIDDAETTYYLGRETFLATPKGRMGPFRESIFGLLSRNAKSATSYFAIPPEQVVEVGMQIDL
jgi:KUP system potassium uptake protein